MSETFVKELRDGAKIHPDMLVRMYLKQWGDEVEDTYKAFTKIPSLENLQLMIGVWTRAKLYYDSLTFNGAPTGQGGAIRLSEIQKAA